MELVVSETVTEKLQGIFTQKYLSITDERFLDRADAEWARIILLTNLVGEIIDIQNCVGALNYQKWSDYLNNLDGIRYIEKFSNIANQTDYLIEEINNNLPFNKILLKDLFYHDNFILIDVEVAEKILVLGMLP